MKMERLRDTVTTQPGEEYWTEREAAGWRLAAIVWEREAARDEGAPRLTEEAPYGMRVGEDCQELVEEPAEMTVLTAITDLIVEDEPISKVAGALNERGYRNRSGGLWSAPQVFQLLPRVIEVGPRIFSTEDWQRRRGRLLRAV